MGVCQFFFFVLILVIESCDFMNDWMLFIEFKLAEKGLVYGPPDEGAVWSLLVFNIFGSLFIVKLWYLRLELFRDASWKHTALLSAIILWIEDVPQSMIDLYIIACRGEPGGFFLAKAAFLLTGVLIQIVIAVYDKCKSHSKSKICWVFIIAAMIITTVEAFAFLFLALTYHGSIGQIERHQFTNDTGGKNNELGYFENVGVFLHHPDFVVNTPTQSAVSEAEWIRLMSINDIRKADNPAVNFNLVHERNDSHFKMAIYQENDEKGNWTLSGCYLKDLATRAMSALNETTCRGASFFSNNRTSMYINFYFEKPDTSVFRTTVFGEIYVNTKVFNNGQCTDLTTPPSIHYYRVNAVSNHDTKNLLMEDDSLSFYRSDTDDMQDVSQVWKTGWAQCKTSGSVAPVLDSGITVECSNTGV